MTAKPLKNRQKAKFAATLLNKSQVLTSAIQMNAMIPFDSLSQIRPSKIGIVRCSHH
jgi:hypothetical protein